MRFNALTIELITAGAVFSAGISSAAIDASLLNNVESASQQDFSTRQLNLEDNTSKILASNTISKVKNETVKHTKKKPVIVKVKKGDYLSLIAKKHKSSVKRLFYANKFIKNPDIIYPGDKVRIPSKNERLKKRAMPVGAVVNTTVKPAPKPTYKAAVRRTTSIKTSAPTVASGSVWDRLAACESGGNWSINTGNGYYGGLQFTLSTWQSVGGSGYPHQNSREEQIKRAEILLARSGWGQWPACTLKLGLR